MTFQERIKSSSASQSAIAEALKVPKTTVRSWTRGYGLPSHFHEWHYIKLLNDLERSQDT